jgi:hypothetical protein
MERDSGARMQKKHRNATRIFRVSVPSLSVMIAVVIATFVGSVPAASTPNDAIAPKDVVPVSADGEVGYWAPASAITDGSIGILAESSTITAGDCKYRQAVDNPHISTSPPRAASAHGYWKKVGGTCPSRANVDVYLQAVWCDSSGCRWRTVASDSKDVYAGGGAGRRATARETCGGTSKVGWRAFVDVDLIGQGDPSGYTYTPGRDLYCYPSS